MASMQKSQTYEQLKSAGIKLRDLKQNPVLRLQLNLLISREMGHAQPPKKLVEAATDTLNALSNDKDIRFNEPNGMDKALDLSKSFGLPYNDSMKAYVHNRLISKIYFALDGTFFSGDDPFKPVTEYAALHGISAGELAKIETDFAKELFAKGYYENSEKLAKRNGMEELASRSRVLLELSSKQV